MISAPVRTTGMLRAPNTTKYAPIAPLAFTVRPPRGPRAMRVVLGNILKIKIAGISGSSTHSRYGILPAKISNMNISDPRSK